jgi:hypothetical protein
MEGYRLHLHPPGRAGPGINLTNSRNNIIPTIIEIPGETRMGINPEIQERILNVVQRLFEASSYRRRCRPSVVEDQYEWAFNLDTKLTCIDVELKSDTGRYASHPY